MTDDRNAKYVVARRIRFVIIKILVACTEFAVIFLPKRMYKNYHVLNCSVNVK